MPAMKTNILMPWSYIGEDRYGYTRKRPGSNLGFHRVWYYYAADLSCWHYEAYDTDMYKLFNKDGIKDSAPTKEAAMEIVDAALAKAGWFLLNEDNIHLLSLL